jgi:hypothetical protein
VGVVVEPGHKDAAVDAHLPLGEKHLLTVLPESTGRRRFLALGTGFEELLRLGEENADNTDGDRDTSYSLLVRVEVEHWGSRDIPAIQKTVFQLSVLPPTPRLAHAAKT